VKGFNFNTGVIVSKICMTRWLISTSHGSPQKAQVIVTGAGVGDGTAAVLETGAPASAGTQAANDNTISIIRKIRMGIGVVSSLKLTRAGKLTQAGLYSKCRNETILCILGAQKCAFARRKYFDNVKLT
jgi:hypothetical protein